MVSSLWEYVDFSTKDKVLWVEKNPRILEFDYFSSLNIAWRNINGVQVTVCTHEQLELFGYPIKIETFKLESFLWIFERRYRICSYLSKLKSIKSILKRAWTLSSFSFFERLEVVVDSKRLSAIYVWDPIPYVLNKMRVQSTTFHKSFVSTSTPPIFIILYYFSAIPFVISNMLISFNNVDIF